MTAAVVVAVMVLMVNLTPGAAAGAVTGEAVGRTRTSGRLFAPPGTLAASLLLPDPVKVRLRPGFPSRPIPPLRRFRRSQALLQAAQTIEDMVKVMEDKGNMQPFNSSLKTELLLLSQEIHSSMASLSNGAENTTLVNFTQETPEPIFNNPVDTSQHIISNPEDTSQHIISDPVDTLQHINSNPEDTSQHIISNPEDTSQHISSIINNLNNTSSVVFSNPKDTSQHIISNPEDTSGHIISNPGDTSQHIISNPEDTSQHIISNPEDTSQHIFSDPEDTSQHIISNPGDTSGHIINIHNHPENTSSTTLNNPQNTLGPILSILNPEHTMEPILSILNPPKNTSRAIVTNPEAQEPEGDTTADDEDIGAAQEFLRRVKEILEGSGIELVLPIDCGRNPLQPDDQLGTSELPWLVALGSREDGRFFYRCPGLIVTNFHVLTDADCTASPNINVVHVSRSGLVPDEGAEENFVVGRRIHPDITTLTDLFSGVNVGLVELAEPFVFHDALQPVCLPGLLDKPDPFAAFSGLAAGYSVIPNSQVGRVAEVYAVNASVYGPAWCRSGVLTRDAPPNATLSLMQVLNERHVCAALDFDEIGKSVLLAEDARTGRVRVVGVGSFANAEHTFPVTYTLVQPHRFWVEVTLKRFLDNTATRKTLEETIDERL